MRQKDIFPVYDKLQNREEKECFLNQHSVLLWLTGLSGAGKTTMMVIILEIN
jgi:adenylylsulfate kinase